MRQLIEELQAFDIYEWFFTVLVFAFMCVLLGAVGMILFTDTEHGNPFITYPLATFFGTMIIMNVGDQNASAKEMFWGWIIITFGLAIMSVIGVGIMWVVSLFT